ncbi:MAG: HAMP domain-containing histidine kinase [Crocinitomicaceae bacterium]|nr:HAMP domain-containing histidine kinase [Crocinitomicaceae bacterium]
MVVALEETADYFIVAVKDNGAGISDKEKEKYFTLFHH